MIASLLLLIKTPPIAKKGEESSGLGLGLPDSSRYRANSLGLVSSVLIADSTLLGTLVTRNWLTIICFLTRLLYSGLGEFFLCLLLAFFYLWLNHTRNEFDLITNIRTQAKSRFYKVSMMVGNNSVESSLINLNDQILDMLRKLSVSRTTLKLFFYCSSLQSKQESQNFCSQG